ncbi:MAG: hypothetical protein US30_C0013G0030 [Candidatus Moranbacteria bacterium GW2011_GWF2_36_839]|nr:MAG: hypothetical protein US27_C0013G0030 [Candidatus Moranbacteria bacterium GW2011_GWF1_36_78]KKQ16633.1 MAG: hypothetical protein US30_C0013G0030 [Candidatus Moranbacteria bacterium GW2011_GWF2_36_839]HAT73533.1 hypothetical protein [Candidatus Moranbacteria bacterium]HBY11491.1 hypothetical protein [Candidatus Moranbacteria bacterium]
MAICKKNVYLHGGELCFHGDLTGGRLVFKAGEIYEAFELPHMTKDVLDFAVISSDGEEHEFFSNNPSCTSKTSFALEAFDFSEEIKELK